MRNELEVALITSAHTIGLNLVTETKLQGRLGNVISIILIYKIFLVFYHMPDIVLGTGETAVSKTNQQHFPQKVYILLGMRAKGKQMNK